MLAVLYVRRIETSFYLEWGNITAAFSATQSDSLPTQRRHRAESDTLAAMSSGAGQRLYFGNLDPQVTQQELEREVNRFGETKSVWVAKNPSGFAFVEYVELRDAEECLKQLNSVRLGDKIVSCGHARAPERSTGTLPCSA